MELQAYIKLYLIAVIVFFVVDMLWLGLIARNFYRHNLEGIISPEVNWYAAIAFYLIYIAGIVLFAIVPAFREASLARALVWGALYGFFTYATYDLTNMATIKQWPLKVVIVDVLWGTFLGSSVATLTYLVGSWFQAR